jgi:hypothetical protein
MNARRLLARLILLSALVPTGALAQVSDADKATARDLTIEGYAALEKKDFTTAADRFARADALYHAPTITLGLARAQVGLGKLLSAQELYSRVTHETVPPSAPAAFTNAVADAQRELAALVPRVPSVIINVKGPDAPKVTLDGAVVPVAALGVKRAADVGKHVIHVEAAGFAPADATVTLAEGRIETVTVELKPGAGPAPTPAGPGPATGPAAGAPPVAGGAPAPDTGGSSTQKTAGIAVAVVGGVGLVVGAVTGGLALSKHSTLSTSCPMGHCPSNEKTGTLGGDVSSYNTMGAISTAGFIAGGALAVTGLVVIFTAPKARRMGALTPLIGPGYVGAAGSF